MSYTAAGVSVRIGKATLLDDVSVVVHPGEVVAVAGPNGAGKSTLLGVLAGDRRPEAGSVTVAGRAIADWPRRELAHRRAVMSVEPTVAFAFTAQDVALLGRLPLHGGQPGESDRAIVRTLLAEVDCADLADRAFATLSTGERQRVSLARALAQVRQAGAEPVTADGEAGPFRRAVGGQEPTDVEERYLLLDEPTSSLDPAHQHLAMGLLRREALAGRGVVAVLHDLNLAAAYADRIVLLAHGRVAASGTPADVLRPRTLAAVFGIPMLVMSHPRLPRALVVPDPRLPSSVD
jgi:iron complex transport system ATP-binding protein